MRQTLLTVLIVLIALCTAAAQSPIEQIWKSATASRSDSNLSSDKITAGLKEALKVSTNKAVAATGRPDGFLGNPNIRIPLPQKLQSAGKGLRLIGMGPQLDQLEVGMNRAAEQATPLAKQIFLNALTKMTITDAGNILKGSDTAATEYFRNTSSADLTTAFTPIVHDQLQKVGVVQQYERLLQNPMAGSLLQSRFNLDNYVVGKTLDGLFYMLGEEEKQIRKNPAAQVTPLLREVFGSMVNKRR